MASEGMNGVGAVQALAQLPAAAEALAAAQAWEQLTHGLQSLDLQSLLNAQAAAAPALPAPAERVSTALPAALPAAQTVERATPSEQRPLQTSVAAGQLGQRLAGSVPATAAQPSVATPVTALAAAQPSPAAFAAHSLPPGLVAVLSSVGYAAPAIATPSPSVPVASGLPPTGSAQPANAQPGNPLLDWARASAGAPAQVLQAAQAMPGPAAALLAQGVDPAIVLTLQAGWETAVLGGPDPLGGSPLLPLAQAWGLPGTAALATLLRDLGGMAQSLPSLANRPSVQLAQLLNVAAAPLPPVVREAASAMVPAAVLLLGFAAQAVPAEAFAAGQGMAGLTLLHGPMPPGTTGFVTVHLAGQPPLTLVRQAPGDIPATRGGVAVGGATLQTGQSAGLSWVAATLGHAAMPDASAWLLPLAAAALAGAPAPLADAAVSVPFGLAPGGWAAHGHVAFANGEVVPFGSASAAGSLSTLHMASAGPGGSADVFATYAGRQRVPIDLAPMQPTSPAWRMDDTAALVAVRAGVAAAGLRAAELYHGLATRPGALAQLAGGEGFSTWEGSPLWLSLAGIGKPAALGVLLHQTAPGRLEVIRTDEGDWIVEHAGGGWAAPRRTRHGRNAAEGEALLMDILYGLTDPAASEPELAAWHVARGEIARAASLPAEAAWRAQEAWAAVARSCVQLTTVQRDAGAAPLPGTAEARLDDAIQAAMRGDPALREAGIPVLDCALRGELDRVAAADGIALATALGRLPLRARPQTGAMAGKAALMIGRNWIQNPSAFEQALQGSSHVSLSRSE